MAKRVKAFLGFKSEDAQQLPLQLSDAEIQAMKKSQLQEALAKLNLAKSGNVPDLKARLSNALAQLRTPPECALDDEPVQKLTTGRATKTGSSSVGGPSGRTAKNGRTAKKWTVTNPAEFAPHYYHKDLFRANFPLVEVVEVHKGVSFPAFDKFQPFVLDPDVTRRARQAWIQRFLDVDCCFKAAENERQAFPAHFAFLESLYMFTRPSIGDVVKQNQYVGKRKWGSADVERALKRPRTENENEGLVLVPSTEDTKEPLGACGSGGNNSGLELACEEAAELDGDAREDTDIPTGFADGILHVEDSRRPDPDKVVCVLERKFAEDKHKWRARFQGGFYAAKQAICNLQRGHGSPVYVLVMTGNTWSYGILVPEGYCQVRGGSPTQASMPEFMRHQQMTGIHETGYDKLCERLEEGTRFYRSCYRDNPQAIYRDGPMLVGKLYVTNLWLPLPKAVAGGDVSSGARQLFDGLMRIVLGDSVMQMSDDDLYLRTRLRMLMSEQRVHFYMGASEKQTRWRYDDIDPNVW